MSCLVCAGAGTSGRPCPECGLTTPSEQRIRPTVIVPCDPTPAMLREGARALDAWSDETLAQEVDAHEMARRVWKAMTSNA